MTSARLSHRRTSMDGAGGVSAPRPQADPEWRTDMAKRTSDAAAQVWCDELGRRRCTAKSKQAGRRCKRRPIPGGYVCVMHGGKIPQVQAAAARRLAAAEKESIATTRPWSQDVRWGWHLYIVRGRDTGRIKIGSSLNPQERLIALQTGCSEELELVTTRPMVHRQVEFAAHERFADERLHGEWFESSPRLMDWIETVKSSDDPMVTGDLPSR